MNHLQTIIEGTVINKHIHHTGKAMVVKVDAYEILVQPCHYDTLKGKAKRGQEICFIADVVPRANGYCQLVFRHMSEGLEMFKEKFL